MDEHDPVADTEFVFRRIHRNYIDASMATPIRFAAFRPNASDTTGLSIVRESLLSVAGLLFTLDPTKTNDYYIARLPVAALRKLGLSVEPDPVPSGPPGHAIIPELSWPAYQADKPMVRPILVELASADIVHAPP